MKRFLRVDLLYNPAYRACALNGITTKDVPFYIECVDGNYTEKDLVERVKDGEEIGVFKLGTRRVSNTEYRHAKPLVFDSDSESFVAESRHSMMGGNFLYSSDSRFRNEINEYPLPVHDRIE